MPIPLAQWFFTHGLGSFSFSSLPIRCYPIGHAVASTDPEDLIATASSYVPPAHRTARVEEASGFSAQRARLASLDVFRGMTIAGMILVNNPGTWASVYWPLRHAEWHGGTPTDLIFPFFLFIVGVSMALSFHSRAERGATRSVLALHVLWRSAVILAVGWFLAGFPHFDLSRIRIPGVLPRIAVCYLFAALVAIISSRRPGRMSRGVVAGTIVVLLVSYWALMTFVPVPGYGVGRLDVEGNLAAYLDRKLLAGHLYKPTWDPEGPLSTLPAIATTLIGALVGEWMRSKRSPQMKTAGLLIMGTAGLILGRLLHPFFPVNKNLWTSTYVILTGGCAMVLLALCYWVVDVKGCRRWATPFLVFGTNALASYVLSSWLAKCSGIFHVAAANGGLVSWHAYIYNRFFAPLASPINASLAFAVFYVLLWLGLMWLLYRRRIFIKI